MKDQNLTTFVIILSVILLNSCSTFKNELIKFNEDKEYFVYEQNKFSSIVLRNNDLQLVDSSNYETFEKELLELKNRYPFRERTEREKLLKQSDVKLLLLYSSTNDCINQSKYEEAIKEANKLISFYPEIILYSDIRFLKGYAYENLGLQDSAKVKYENFLKYSSQKHSARYRGYRDYDKNDSLYIAQRNYAREFLLNQPETTETEFNFSSFKPKMYYGSFLPGYTINNEDIGYGTKGVISVNYGINRSGELLFGASVFYILNERFNINPSFHYSKNETYVNFGVPIQLYKSEDNSFGIKATPFISYLRIDSLKVEDQMYPIKRNLLNFGGRISIGYYPLNHLCIGAYYQYNYFNKNNPYYFASHNISLWHINEYDISAYYNIFKFFSIKAGVKNNDLVAGIFWQGWEVSYNISNPGLIFRINMH